MQYVFFNENKSLEKKYTDLKISGSCPDTERCLWAVILLKANKMTQIELITKKTVYLHCFNQTQKNMNEEKIGFLAGMLWDVLNEGPKTVKEIKSATKLKDIEVYAAIGWLSREGTHSAGQKGKSELYALS